VAAGRELEPHPLAGAEQRRVDAGVLLDPERAVRAAGRRDQAEPPAAVGLGERPLLVRRRDAGAVRHEPDLQEVDGRVLRAVELGVHDAGAGAHPLDLAGPEHALPAGGVLVGEGALEHVRQDLHVAVAVAPEALAGLDAVLVHHPERAEAHLLGVVVRREREGVAGVEPAVVVVAPVLCLAHGDHGLEGKAARRGVEAIPVAPRPRRPRLPRQGSGTSITSPSEATSSGPA
jgi:hypothetical protein